MSANQRFIRSGGLSSVKKYNAQRRAALNAKQKLQVRRMLNNTQELKYISTYVNNGGVSNTLGVNDISAVAQGVTDNLRVGDRLKWCGKLQFRLMLTSADQHNAYRFIIFQWHPNTVPVVNNILVNGPTGFRDINSLYSHDNRQLYKIMYDRTFITAGNGLTSATPVTTTTNKIITGRISTKRIAKSVQFDASSTTGTNRIYYILGSDSSAVTHPTYSMSTRLFFRDS